MKQTSSVTFRVIKSSWGIMIRVKASASTTVPSELDSDALITGAARVRFHPSVRLSREERETFLDGLRSVLQNQPVEEPISIWVEEIYFIDTDFQMEGLYWAGRMLAADLLEVEFQPPEVTFDRQANRYIFP